MIGLSESTQLIHKLSVIMHDAENEHGAFKVFALLRPDGRQRFDVVVSAVWSDDDTGQIVRELTTTLSKQLSITELLGIGSVIGVKTKSEVIKAISTNYATSDKPIHIKDEAFANIDASEAWILKAVM